MLSTRYSSQILMELEFSRHIGEKYSNIEFHENPFSGSHVDPCERTDGRRDRPDEDNSRFSQFYDLAYKLRVPVRTI